MHGGALMVRGICACSKNDIPGMIRDMMEAVQTKTLPPKMEVLALMFIADAMGGQEAIDALETRLPEHLIPSFKFTRGWIACSEWNMLDAFLHFEEARRLGHQCPLLPLWRAVAAAYIGHDIGLTRDEFHAALQ
jgi:hypothetical protein